MKFNPSKRAPFKYFTSLYYNSRTLVDMVAAQVEMYKEVTWFFYGLCAAWKQHQLPNDVIKAAFPFSESDHER